jgi:cytochrome c oxidase subunit II
VEGRRTPHELKRRLVALTLAPAMAVAVSGCGGQSPLDPRSGPARDITTLWWWLFAVASLFFVGTVFLLLVSWLWRKREGIPLIGSSPKLTTGLVVAFGMLVPATVLVTVFVVSDLIVIGKTDAPKAATTKLTVNVIGHQWFWEVRYGNTTAVTANEIHIPVKTRAPAIGGDRATAREGGERGAWRARHDGLSPYGLRPR